jgi:hypothetical protein
LLFLRLLRWLSFTACFFLSESNNEAGGTAHGVLVKIFFNFFSASLPKRMVQTVLVAKGEETRITRLCGREGR